MDRYLKPRLIIVTGLPCTGKTTLAKRIAGKFSLPLITKDQIKERLFDRLGWSDRDWSRKLSLLTYDLLFDFAGSLLAAKISCVVESNFTPEWDTPNFRALKKLYPFVPFQVVCISAADVLVARFEQRMATGQRHQGHVDSAYLDEFKELVARGPGVPLDIGGEAQVLDTSDFQQIDYAGLYQKISEMLEG